MRTDIDYKVIKLQLQIKIDNYKVNKNDGEDEADVKENVSRE